MVGPAQPQFVFNLFLRPILSFFEFDEILKISILFVIVLYPDCTVNKILDLFQNFAWKV